MYSHVEYIPLQFCSKNIFSIKYEWVQNSVIINILFNAKYDEVSCENYIITVCEIDMNLVLYILYLWTAPKTCVVSSALLQREQFGESTNFLKYRKSQVGSLY